MSAPPFIVGAGRSGTTLLRLMIDAHPLYAIPAETHFLPSTEPLLRRETALTRFLPRQREKTRSELFDLITSFPTWADFSIPAEELRTELSRIRKFTLASGVRAFYQLYARARGKPHWGDKTPDYCTHLPLIARILPEARFIHIIRDGRDVAVSVRPLWFRPGGDIAALARDWKQRVLKAREDSRKLAHYLEVRYEELLDSPEPQLRRVCTFLGVDFDEAMLRYWITARERLGEVGDRMAANGSMLITREQRLENHRRTSTLPDPSRSGRWRLELSPEEDAQYRETAGDLLRELGYER